MVPRTDAIWSGTITGRLESIVDNGLGSGTVEMEIDAFLEERTTQITIDSRDVGRYTQLYAGGTKVRNVSDHTNEVDGTRCTADDEVTLTDLAPSGWIIEKSADVDITPFIGFDVPFGGAWYNLTFYTADVGRVGQTECTDDDAEGPYDIVAPTIGHVPIDVEQWDPDMRALEMGGLLMSGSYDRHWVTGDDINDQNVEWHIIRESP